MDAKQRVYDVLHRVVVIGLVADAVWRWRKFIYWCIGGVVIWRVLLLGVIFAAVFFSLGYGDVSAQSPYPGGVRNPAEWYYCYAHIYNEDDNVSEPFGEMTCEHILWQPLGGGGYTSQNMVGGGTVGGVVTSGGGQLLNLRAWVMPPQGMKSYTYSCNVQIEGCHMGSGSGGVGGSIDSNVGTGFSEDLSHWSVTVTTPTSGPACAQTDLDVVGSFRALAYDSFWTVDVPASWTTSGSTLGSYFEINMSTTNENRVMDGDYSCNILSWESHPAWLSTNPPWLPGPGDLVIPEPTPVPTGTWDIVPWVPISDSVYVPIFELGPGEDGGCEMIIPQQSVEIGGNEYGWYGFEICRTDFALSLSIFNEDVNYWLNVALSLGGLAIVFSILKRA